MMLVCNSHLRVSAFAPKVVGTCTPIELMAFNPTPFISTEQEWLHTLCPVQALRMYVYRTKVLRRSDQMFVSLVKPHTGRPICKQRLSCSIVGV